MPLPILGSRLLILINSTAFFWLIVALIVTHTDWVCRVARVLYLFYYFDMVATIVLLRVVVSDYTYQDIKDCGRILLG